MYLRPNFRYPDLSQYHSLSGFIQRMSQGRLMMAGARDGYDMVVVGGGEWSVVCCVDCPMRRRLPAAMLASLLLQVPLGSVLCQLAITWRSPHFWLLGRGRDSGAWSN